MPTRTQQADILSIAYASHGDTKHIVLFPANPEECFTFAVRAFDLAERFQTPVFVASDLDIGMNDWMCRRLTWDDAYRPDRGKVLGADELARIGRFSRYLGENGDAIAARTLPGVDPRGAYFTRGSGHDVHAGYTEDAAAYAEVLARLGRKFQQAAGAVPEPAIDVHDGGASVGIISDRQLRRRGARGGRCAASRRAVDRLHARARLPVQRRPSARFLSEHDRLFVVEQNRDAQLRSLLTLETGTPRDRMTPILDYGGVPLSAEPIVEFVTRSAQSVTRRMTSIQKPPVRHPGLPRNALGLTTRDYEGGMSTLCAGCGHDSITAALIQAVWELDLPPHRAAKMSGIGCSSKTTAYFMRESHGFNAVHGRMPAVASGVHAANRELVCIGISGDGDSLSIGLGQMCHAIRRNVDMLYVIENNGVYGLTKGQFSASADVGSKSKRGEPNAQPPIDPVLLALTLGATFVARGFSGDKPQLVPILKAGAHPPRLCAGRRHLTVRDVQRSRGLDEELSVHARPPARRGTGGFRSDDARDRRVG